MTMQKLSDEDFKVTDKELENILPEFCQFLEKHSQHYKRGILMRLLTELRESRSQLARVEELVSALEFYADKKTYGSDDKSRSTGNETFDIVCFDFDRNLEPKKDFAGKRARLALEKWSKS